MVGLLGAVAPVDLPHRDARVVEDVRPIVVINKVDRPAARLLIPYFAWVAFASLLNVSIWLLN